MGLTSFDDFGESVNVMTKGLCMCIFCGESVSVIKSTLRVCGLEVGNELLLSIFRRFFVGCTKSVSRFCVVSRSGVLGSDEMYSVIYMAMNIEPSLFHQISMVK